MGHQNMPNALDIMTIRSLFDEVMKKHISRLMKIDFASELSFDLINVSCLILLVEKEKEFNQSNTDKGLSHSPDRPKRYNQGTLLDELAELGVRVAQPETVFSSLIDNGYASVDSEGEFKAQIPAFAVVNLLNELFPEMQGIHLVAYILQFIDEVISGRKNIEDSINVFDQTLFSRGVALGEYHRSGSKNKKAAPRSHEAPDKKNTERKTAEKDEPGRQNYALKLSRLRSLKANAQLSRPAIITSDNFSGRKIKVKEVFIQNEVPEIPVPQNNHVNLPDTDLLPEDADIRPGDVTQNDEIEPRPFQPSDDACEKDNDEADIPGNAGDVTASRESPDEFERMAEGASIQDDDPKRNPPVSPLEKEAVIPPIPPSDSEPVDNIQATVHSEAENAPAEAEPPSPGLAAPDSIPHSVKTVEPPQSDPESHAEIEPPAEETDFAEPAISDAMIEKQIADLQKKIATPCPLCESGQILSGETDKGKTFFSCNNPACPFVSWTKPWNYECPVCKNPFLTEFVLPDGKMGLKCPKATCDYVQGNLEDPQKNMPTEPSPKKRVKKVRRVRRKR